jgi:hypothetical protein
LMAEFAQARGRTAVWRERALGHEFHA